MKKPKVDQSLCDGFKVCISMAPDVFEINKNDSLFDALKQLPGVEVQRVGDNQYITSIDGEKGFFIYEVDGTSPVISIDQYKPRQNIILHLKKLISVNKKRIEVKVKNREAKLDTKKTRIKS